MGIITKLDLYSIIVLNNTVTIASITPTSIVTPTTNQYSVFPNLSK